MFKAGNIIVLSTQSPFRHELTNKTNVTKLIENASKVVKLLVNIGGGSESTLETIDQGISLAHVLSAFLGGSSSTSFQALMWLSVVLVSIVIVFLIGITVRYFKKKHNKKKKDITWRNMQDESVGQEESATRSVAASAPFPQNSARQKSK